MIIPVYKNGYSLVEALIAIAVLLLSIVGPLTIASKSLQTSFNSRDQAVATFLAQEAIEGVVFLRQNSIIAAIQSGNIDETWDWAVPAVNACGSDGCNIDVGTGVIINCTADETACVEEVGGISYTRELELANVSTDAVSVTVTVSWDNPNFGAVNQQVEISTVLYDTYGNL